MILPSDTNTVNELLSKKYNSTVQEGKLIVRDGIDDTPFTVPIQTVFEMIAVHGITVEDYINQIKETMAYMRTTKTELEAKMGKLGLGL